MSQGQILVLFTKFLCGILPYLGVVLPCHALGIRIEPQKLPRKRLGVVSIEFSH